MFGIAFEKWEHQFTPLGTNNAAERGVMLNRSKKLIKGQNFCQTIEDLSLTIDNIKYIIFHEIMILMAI